MSTQVVQSKDPSAVEFVPHGGNDAVKLSLHIVKNLIAVPTRSGKTCSDRDALKFIAMCRARRLNPFEGDAFLVGYDGKNGPEFSLITAHQAFLKRAELHPEFDGMDSGIVIHMADGSLLDRDGDFHLADESVVGGWARVHFKTRKHPTYRRIRLERFNKGFAQWQVDPAGMICKCAEADALRSSFPTMLGGLYMREEGVSASANGALDAAAANLLPEQVQVAAHSADQSEAGASPSKPAQTAQEQLCDFVVAAGYSFDDFMKWAVQDGHAQPDEWTGFEDLPVKVASRFLRAKDGLIAGLAQVKGGQ